MKKILQILLFAMIASGLGNQVLLTAEPPPAAKLPFSAEQAKELQRQWAAYLGREVVETNAAGMRMILVPPGVFEMGTPNAEMDKLIKDMRADPKLRRWINWVIGHTLDRGTRQIKITKPFYVAETEVTVEQFRKFVEATGYKTYPEIFDTDKDDKLLAAKYWRVPSGSFWDGKEWTRKPGAAWDNVGYEQADDAAIFNLSWYDSMALCHWLGKTSGHRYRLPTEAEWEYACRAGTTTLWHFGNDPAIVDEYALTDLLKPGRARQKKPNAFGLYDMHGSMWERCVEWGAVPKYHHEFQGAPPTVDPAGAICMSGARLRGGSFDFSHWLGRSASRIGGGGRRGRHIHIGFRVISPVEMPGRSLDALPLAKSKSSQEKSAQPLRPAAAEQFVQRETNPVFVVGPCPTGEESRLGRFSVAREQTGYYLWYPGTEKDYGKLFPATSTDGLQWKKHTILATHEAQGHQQPQESTASLWHGLPGLWHDKYIGMPHVQLVSLAPLPRRDVEKAWFMWHIGVDESGKSGLGLAVLAQKPNEPWNNWTNRWSTHGLNPLLTGPIQDPCVVRAAGGFRMWCVRPADGKTRICYAESPDAVNWIEPTSRPDQSSTEKHRHVTNLLPLGSEGEFDSHGHADPCVLKVGRQFFMWYLGNDGRRWRVGLAVSHDGLKWTKSKANPILETNSKREDDSGSILGISVLKNNDHFDIWYSTLDRNNDARTIKISYAKIKSSDQTK